MDIRKVKKLIELLEESGISELEITEGEESVRISRHPSGTAAPMHYAMPPPAPVAAPAAASPPPAAETAASDSAPVETRHVVRAPMVGTFYRSSSPGAKPFVDVGQTVRAGQTLCIIEAMKIMNEIESDVSGKVVKVLVDDGAPVEYNQSLIQIDPA